MQNITDGVEAWNLTNTTCANCNGLLSAKPIFIDTQGTNTCSRCATKLTTFKRNDLYEVLAKQFVFPCVFNGAGCMVTQPFDQIGIHEKSCVYRIFTCYCLWSGNALDFIKHFKCQHHWMIIRDNERFLLKDNQTCLLLKSRGLYFVVNYVIDRNVIRMHISSVSNAGRECNPTFLFVQLGSIETSEIVLDTFKVLACPNVFCWCALTSNISDERLNSIYKTIVCPNCSIQMTPPILQCSNGHTTCVECTGSELAYCTACLDMNQFTCNTELECVALATPYSCRWNCGNKIFSYKNIRKHEHGCKKRIYKCWHEDGCEWYGNLNELFEHHATCLQPLYEIDQTCIFLIDVNKVTFHGATFGRVVSHLIVYNCRFNVVFDQSNGITSLYIHHYDVHGFGRFRFVAELRHLDNINRKPNRTYNFNCTRGGNFKAIVPEEDIAEFGGPDCYEITARAIRLNEEERIAHTNNLYKCFKNYSML